MKRDRLFRDSAPKDSGFKFDAKVAAVFNDMITRSVPFYVEQQRMVAEIVRQYWQPGTNIYDLGCATGTTLINLSREVSGSGRLIGYDNSAPMLEQARYAIAAHGLAERISLRIGDLDGDPAALSLENAGVVLLCWTLQFVRPVNRYALVRMIHDVLVDGGVLLVTEKVLANNADLDRDFIAFYYASKVRTGYSETEIHKKREALENVLVPYRVDENKKLFADNGFRVVETFFQWYNFAGFICQK